MSSQTPEQPLAALRALREQVTAAPAAAPASTTTAAPAPAAATGPLQRLRNLRTQLLTEQWGQGGLANNPLQMLAAPVLQSVGHKLEAVGALNIVANIGKGAALGSIIIPDDAAVDPEDPIPALQTVSAFVGAGAEGALADFGILRGLNAVKAAATARGARNVAASADKAMRIFGAGEDLSKFRKIVGGAALGGTSELALRAAAFEDPAEALKAAGLVTIGGAALGGALASLSRVPRATVATARAARSFAEEFAESAKRPLLEQAEAALAAGQPALDAGLGSKTASIQRALSAQLDAADVASLSRKQIAEIIPESAGTTSDPNIEFLFDRSSPTTLTERLKQSWDKAHETFTNSFIYESKLRGLPSTSGIDGLDMTDDIRVLRHGVERSTRLADKDVGYVMTPLKSLKGDSFKAGWNAFERIVVLRDLLETSQKGLQLPLGVEPEAVARELFRLETQAPQQVMDAVLRHKELVGGWRQDLIRRGRLSVNDGYDNYFPHRIIEDLADEDAAILGQQRSGVSPSAGALEKGKLRDPKRGYTKHREGSAKRIATDYLDTMHRASRRFHTDNVIEEFLQRIEASPALNRSKKSFEPEQLRKLLRGQAVAADGQAWKTFHPKGAVYYRASAVDDEAYRALVESIEDELEIPLEDIPELRDILAVGKKKTLILPAELADRLEQFYQPDPLRTTATSVRGATAWWKRNTIWWGLNRFFLLQALGDSTNMFRSNPAAFLQIRGRRLESPTAQAITEIFAKHGAPVMSPQQAVTTMLGGAAGLGVDEALNSDPNNSTKLDEIAAIIMGAGLGYAIGTRRMAARGTPFSLLYDQADEMGAINSGATVSEETVARRTLGESASRLPTLERPHWLRAKDTIATLLSGKPHGDPYSFARVPFEVLQTIQVERENVLRLASYIQMTQAGTPPLLAAKRARESLVDYGKFTDFENKIVRGFLLPFYAFYRHNTPNWVKAALGRDVGGKTKLGMLAVGALAAGDIAAQMWNEQFFPDVERELRDFRKDRFHIIIGNPVTGEPYTDVNGRPMIAGWEMPYETALEFFGLARPGVLYSEFFGMGGAKENVSLVTRFQRSAEEAAWLRRGPGKQFVDLLSPFIKEPMQIKMNKDLFMNTPIVPERYLNTKYAKKEILEHAAQTFFRQYREYKRTASEITGKRFDPLTSAMGLGLPLERVNLDREIQGYLHEQADASEITKNRLDAEFRKPIDDLLYSRAKFSEVEPNELLKLETILSDLGYMRNEDRYQRAMNYYMNRGGKGSLARRWESMPFAEKKIFFDGLPDWAQTYLMMNLNFGDDFTVETSGQIGALGG